MRTLLMPAAALLVVLAVVPASTGCGPHHRHRSDGPAERAGQSVDRALDKTGDAIENTGDKIDRALPGD